MSQQQDLRTGIKKLAAEETTEALQARLDAAGLKIDLSSVPTRKVSKTFVRAMSTLLERSVGDLTVDQKRAITAEVKATSAALETKVTAQTILQGFRKRNNGVIELTLPVGTTIQEAGKLLNAAAKEKGMKYPVFYEGDAEFWAENEANPDLQTRPGETYHFRIPTDSVWKTRDNQVRDHGKGAPLGAIAIAEACERLNTENYGTLFKHANGNKVWVRGSAPGVALYSLAKYGVYVYRIFYGYRGADVAFASSVSARSRN